MKDNESINSYLYKAKLAELSEKYKKDGYNVEIPKSVGPFYFDFVATKENKPDLYVKIKTNSLSFEESTQLAKMASYVESLSNARFELIVVTPPKNKTIEVEGLDTILFQYLQNNIPYEIKKLKYETIIAGVVDVELDYLQVKPHAVFMEGEASLEVDLSLINGGVLLESFPFRFNVKTDRNFNLKEVKNLNVDVSSFTEQV